jgi:hypothetical protein
MARKSLNKRQITVYARDDTDVDKWKKLCKPLTLNGWILEMIEKGIENSFLITIDTEELNSLRKENMELKNEIEIVKVKAVSKCAGKNR